MPDETAPQPEKPVPTENETPATETPLPAEYEQAELPKHFLRSIPRHFHTSLRPSAMPLASEDSFSRRITPLGVYYPKDRYRQERQFASAVVELMEKKAFEKKSVNLPPTAASLPPTTVNLPPTAASLPPTEVKAEPGNAPSVEPSKEQSSMEPPKEQPKEHPSKEQSSKEPPKEQSKEHLTETPKDPHKERHVSIVDQIKPPPASLKPLRIKNPDTLAAPDEDYRADKTAPRTPANVRGNRSALHKVGPFCGDVRVGDTDVGGRNPGFFCRAPRRAGDDILREPGGLARFYTADDGSVSVGQSGGF